MDVSGSLTDPIPRVYDGVPRYYDTTGIVSSIITTRDAELARSLIKSELTKTDDILQHWNADKQYSIDELDWAQVYALYQLMFDTKQTLEREIFDFVLQRRIGSFRFVQNPKDFGRYLRVKMESYLSRCST